MILLLLVGIQCWYYYPRLPGEVASHFDGAGEPNGWSSKASFVTLYLGITFSLALLFALLPKLVRVLPTSLVNLPHRDYWLAPERKEASLGYLERQLVVFAIATVAFSATVGQLVIHANLDPYPRLSMTIVWALAIYFIFTGGWLVHMVRRFHKPPAGAVE